jgi:hypothetical protein
MAIEPETEVVEGVGWRFYKKGDRYYLKFKSTPDVATRNRLRNFAYWCPDEYAWAGHPRRKDEMLNVAKTCETWESVGENEPSLYDGCDEHDITGRD